VPGKEACQNLPPSLPVLRQPLSRHTSPKEHPEAMPTHSECNLAAPFTTFVSHSEPGYSHRGLCSGLDLSSSTEAGSRDRERGMDRSVFGRDVMDRFADSSRISDRSYPCGTASR
jgi:hypothetical protein